VVQVVVFSENKPIDSRLALLLSDPFFSTAQIEDTVVPEELRKWAGTFCVLLPHGRDE
jgi:hypothetical protein